MPTLPKRVLSEYEQTECRVHDQFPTSELTDTEECCDTVTPHRTSILWPLKFVWKYHRMQLPFFEALVCLGEVHPETQAIQFRHRDAGASP